MRRDVSAGATGQPGVAAQAESASTAAPGHGASEVSAQTELRRRRDALADQVTELHWDLGGLAYEMAIRDHFRLDVLVRRAALLQERDAELAELERLLRMEEAAVAGHCPHCSAPHSRGAMYCWQCGATLMERVSSSALAGQDGADSSAATQTAVMEALLPPDSAGSGSAFGSGA